MKMFLCLTLIHASSFSAEEVKLKSLKPIAIKPNTPNNTDSEINNLSDVLNSAAANLFGISKNLKVGINSVNLTDFGDKDNNLLFKNNINRENWKNALNQVENFVKRSESKYWVSVMDDLKKFNKNFLDLISNRFSKESIKNLLLTYKDNPHKVNAALLSDLNGIFEYLKKNNRKFQIARLWTWGKKSNDARSILRQLNLVYEKVFLKIFDDIYKFYEEKNFKGIPEWSFIRSKITDFDYIIPNYYLN